MYILLIQGASIIQADTLGFSFSLFVCCWLYCAAWIFYCSTQICIARTCYGNVAGWLAGWVSVTRRYCIKMAKPILKLFRPSGSPIILVSSDPALIPNSFSWGVKYTGWENWRFSCDFRRKSPFISETARDRPIVTMER